MASYRLFFAGMMILVFGVPVLSGEPPRLPEFNSEQQQLQPVPNVESAAETPLPLHRDRGSQSMSGADSRTTGGLPSFGTILMALAVVLLLVFAVARIYGTGASDPVNRASSPVDVLFRQNMDGKNSICIVRVGSRLLVLASTPNGLTTLSEITDEVEVESLAIELRAAHESSDGAFGSVTRWLERVRPQPGQTQRPRPRPSKEPVSGLTVREVEEGRRAG